MVPRVDVWRDVVGPYPAPSGRRLLTHARKRPLEAFVHWIWFIIVGAIVGALGRLLHPGKDPMGWLLTIAIGIISMIVAAAISGGWIAFVIGVVIAVVLVALVGRFFGDRPVARRA
jgi:uncharacterized membrane protein YeaQ/YmgE (transglycosylase-associated protein family)